MMYTLSLIFGTCVVAIGSSVMALEGVKKAVKGGKNQW